jgi:hypothetical protein
MVGDQFSIRYVSDDALVYDEGAGRSIQFGCKKSVNPPRVWAPASGWWVQRTPEWAHGRREVIVDRLRRSGVVLYEQGENLTTIRSLDGTFVVECYSQPDERAAPWQTTQVVLKPSGRVIVRLPLFEVSGEIHFSGAGVVELPLLSRYGPRHQLWVNVAHEKFRLDADETEQPLKVLAGRLELDSPKFLMFPTSRQPSWRRPVQDVGTLIICALFVAGGIWMSFT